LRTRLQGRRKTAQAAAGAARCFALPPLLSHQQLVHLSSILRPVAGAAAAQTPAVVVGGAAAALALLLLLLLKQQLFLFSSSSSSSSSISSSSSSSSVPSHRETRSLEAGRMKESAAADDHQPPKSGSRPRSSSVRGEREREECDRCVCSKAKSRAKSKEKKRWRKENTMLTTALTIAGRQVDDGDGRWHAQARRHHENGPIMLGPAASRPSSTLSISA
jgi:hypothetical protein